MQLLRRPRRLRLNPSIRALVRETRLQVEDLIAPLFVREGNQKPEPIHSMPGIFRFSIKDLVKECVEIYQLGIRAVAIFPCMNPKLKDARGTLALDANNLLNRAVRAVKEKVPELLVITDVALDPYTSHGHDGVLNFKKTDVDNDATVKILAEMAVVQARAGSDIVAPSDMMDGRIRAIREHLDSAGLIHTIILSYSAKYASSYYGPFRDAVGSAQAAGTHHLDKRAYQMDPANAREAVIETMLDENEGADILMIKPAGPYLDIIAQLRARTHLPVAAYQVSGEYAQIHAAAKLGWLDLKKTRDESLLAIKRAGADMIFTYFAKEIALC
ncbi:MAG: porphobilinogen synthase [Verrucomicrobiota bacterium]